MRTFLALIVILLTLPAMAQQPQQDKPDIPALIKAAEQGDVEAQLRLANEYLTGQNIAQNSSEAIKWYTKAAEQGDPAAQSELCILYTGGIVGIRKDYIQAYMWLEIAADSFLPSTVASYREKMVKEMTPAQMAESQRLASEWKSKHPQSPPVSKITPKMKAPVPLYQPLPAYTDEARQAKVEGVVVLQCIVRKDGTVDSFKVIKTLDFGLTESAIKTIATQWKFNPGTLNGVPVDTQITIEVVFRFPK
jgi:TonB family protein